MTPPVRAEGTNKEKKIPQKQGAKRPMHPTTKSPSSGPRAILRIGKPLVVCGDDFNTWTVMPGQFVKADGEVRPNADVCVLEQQRNGSDRRFRIAMAPGCLDVIGEGLRRYLELWRSENPADLRAFV